MADHVLGADDIDLSTLTFWAQDPAARDAVFEALRRERPIARFGPMETPLMESGLSTKGYWAVTRYDDVREVSRAPERFSSARGVIWADSPPEITELASSFLAMDAPRHTKLRRLVQAAFTPRQIARMEAQIAALSEQVVSEFLEAREGDFVALLSERLPMMTINAILGVPEADQPRLAHAADIMVGVNDPELVGDDPLAAMWEALQVLHGAAIELADQRARHPGDDLMTALVQAEVDGERLTAQEIGAFMVLLSVAGNDTTRHTTSDAAAALWRDFPEQRAIVERDPSTLPIAVEECLRWASPVMTFRRTATCDTELAGQPIAADERVVMFYRSANRDEAVFDDPFAFDVTRQPNRHVAFGGGGPHFCLGASLARTQLRCVLEQLLTRVRDMELGEGEYLVTNFICGMKRMPVSVAPR